MPITYINNPHLISENDKNIVLYRYNESESDIIPDNIISIHFKNLQMESINALPTSLKKLTINSVNNFNTSMDNLPNKLYILEINNKFNNKIDNLPTNLKILSLGNSFTKNINKIPLITELNLNILKPNNKFYFLPKSLKSITSIYINYLINNLPKETKNIKLLINSNTLINNLPNKLEILQINTTRNLNNLPNIKIMLYSLKGRKINPNTKIDTIIYFNNSDDEINIVNLPKTVKHIEFMTYNYKELEFINEGVKSISFLNLNHQINDLPSSIEKIKISKDMQEFINPIYKDKIEFIESKF